MADAELEKMESAGFAASEQLRDKLAVPQDVALTPGRADGANGENSLDEAYLLRLERREHLNDDFLNDDFLADG